MELNNFVFYGNWMDSIELLNDAQQLQLYKTISYYGTRDKMWSEELDPAVKSIFNLIKPQIDNAKSKYQARVEGGKTAGRKKSINDDKVRELKKLGYKAKEIAEMLNISTTAVYHSDGWKYEN